MSDTMYGPIFFDFINLTKLIVNFFTNFFDSLSQNLWEFLSDIALPSWLETAFETLKLDAFLSQFSLFSLLFSGIIVGVIIVYFFIP